jgi:hypothetical protein
MADRSAHVLGPTGAWADGPAPADEPEYSGPRLAEDEPFSTSTPWGPLASGRLSSSSVRFGCIASEFGARYLWPGCPGLVRS